MKKNIMFRVKASHSMKFATVIIATGFMLGVLQVPASSEPTGLEPLRSVIVGTHGGDADIQAIWDGALRPKMQTLNARFNTASGVYLLSIKKDRCVNTGNVPNLFSCPARLAVMTRNKPTLVQTYGQFYFSGELPTTDAAPSYVEQTSRNRTRVALDADQGVLLVEDTNNGSTGSQTLPFNKSPLTKP
jgi:hypothetical protein